MTSPQILTPPKDHVTEKFANMLSDAYRNSIDYVSAAVGERAGYCL